MQRTQGQRFFKTVQRHGATLLVTVTSTQKYKHITEKFTKNIQPYSESTVLFLLVAISEPQLFILKYNGNIADSP